MSPPAPPHSPTDSTFASLLLSGGGSRTFPPNVPNSGLQSVLWGPAWLCSAQTPAPGLLHQALNLRTASPAQPLPSASPP